MVTEKCALVDDNKICFNNYFLNSGLQILIKFNDGFEIKKSFNPTVSGFLYRFLGSPPVSLHCLVKFTNDKIGLVHSFGFTLLSKKKYATPLS
jgi:hypothetical protein